MNQNDTIPEINGIEILDSAPEGADAFTRRYYKDAAEELMADAMALPAREHYCIAPKVGWPKFIYRKPAVKKAKGSKLVTVERSCFVWMQAPCLTKDEAAEVMEHLFGKSGKVEVTTESGITLTLVKRETF